MTSNNSKSAMIILIPYVGNSIRGMKEGRRGLQSASVSLWHVMCRLSVDVERSNSLSPALFCHLSFIYHVPYSLYRRTWPCNTLQTNPWMEIIIPIEISFLASITKLLRYLSHQYGRNRHVILYKRTDVLAYSWSLLIYDHETQSRLAYR
jgi:hypothetical protein